MYGFVAAGQLIIVFNFMGGAGDAPGAFKPAWAAQRSRLLSGGIV